MIIVPQRIVRINDLNLTTHFLQLPEIERKKLCSDILEKGFDTMIATDNLNVKAKITKGLFERSIRVLESEESYEECAVLKEVMDMIPRVVKKIKKELAIRTI